jgi:hypothetical protein
MTIAIIVGIAVGGFLVFALCLWGISDTIDKGIKHYIDYSRKEKDDDRPRRT